MAMLDTVAYSGIESSAQNPAKDITWKMKKADHHHLKVKSDIFCYIQIVYK